MLQEVGHVQYIGWRMDFYCQTHLVKDLQNQAKDMEEELGRWNEEVSQARKRFYELNYYTTHQLLVLRSALGKMKSSGQATCRCPQQAQVMALLQSISTQITSSIVMNVVQHITALEQSGMQRSPTPQSIHAASEELELPFQSAPTPIDQSDDVLLAVEHSKDMQSMPQVTLSQEELNETQIEHFTNMLNQYGYSKFTALKAIEEVGSGDWNDVQNWLEEHGDRFEEIFQNYDQEHDIEQESQGDQDEDSESGSQGEVPERKIGDEFYTLCILSVVHSHFYAGIPLQSPPVSSSTIKSQTRIVVTCQQLVDDTNPEVQLLLDAEMGTPEQCIRAIEIHGTAHEAMDYMMEIVAEEDEGFFPMLPVSQDLSLPSQHFIGCVNCISVSVLIH